MSVLATRREPLAYGVMLGALFLAVYGPLVPGLVRDWLSHPMLSQGFAIPVIAAVLVWMRRRALTGLPVRPSGVGLGLLAAALLLSTLGEAGGEPFLTRLSLVPALLGLVWAMAGWPVAKAVIFPIGYLIFMVPPPYVALKTAMVQSREIDATMAAWVLQAAGVPVFREANFLHLPNMVLEVADPCSSVIAIAALSALAGAYAYVTQERVALRVLLFASAFPLAVVSNIVRIVVLSAGVYHVGPAMLSYITEQTYGVINFLVFSFLLVAVDRALAALFPRRSPEVDSRAA